MGMTKLLDNMGGADKGKRTTDRKSRLAALLVAYHADGQISKDETSCREDSYEWEPNWLWARVLPYLSEDQGGSHMRERASSSGEAAGALDEEDASSCRGCQQRTLKQSCSDSW